MAIDRIGAMTQRMAQMGGFGGGFGVGGLDTGRQTVPAIRGGDGAGGASFEDTLKKFVNDVSAQQDAATELQGKFLRGENVELHQVMAAGEEAGIALEMMIEVRNKVTEAYRTLIAIQS